MSNKVQMFRRDMLSVFRKFDGWMADHVRDFNVACASGCSMCCHHDVDASGGEMAIIMDAVVQWPKAEQDALLERAQAVMAKRAALPNAEPMTRFAAKIACPLLKDGKCSVYDVRPFMCRGYVSRSKPICDESFRTGTAAENAISALQKAAEQSLALGSQTGPLHELSTWLVIGLNDDGMKRDLLRAKRSA